MRSATFGFLMVFTFCTSSVAEILDSSILQRSLSGDTKNSVDRMPNVNGIINIDAANEEGSLLLDLVRNGALQLQADDISKKEVKAVKREEVYTHLIQNGGARTDFTKPSIGFMLKVFEHLLDGEGLDKAVGHTDKLTRNSIQYSDTIRSFTAKQYREQQVIFNIPALPKHERVTMAEIRLHNNKNKSRRRRFVLLVRRDKKTVDKITIKAKEINSFLYIPKKIITRLNRFHGNFSIVLRDKTKKHKSSFTENAPILVIYSSDNGFMKSVYKSYTSNQNKVSNSDNQEPSRSRRSAKNEQQRKRRRRKKNKWADREAEPCKIHDFRVDFDLIGWGPWIIHPKTYNARVCYGQCPSPIGHEFTPTNHAMLQTLMKMKRPRAAPEPCCVPTKLRPLSMLYFEYDDIVVRHHEDMIVSECGCR